MIEKALDIRDSGPVDMDDGVKLIGKVWDR